MNRYVDEFSVTLLLYGSLDHIYLPILFRAITVTIHVTFIFLIKINTLRVTNKYGLKYSGPDLSNLGPILDLQLSE